MQKEEQVWEDRKIHTDAHGSLYVNVPRSWLDLPVETVFNARLVFEKKDGKRTVRLVFPGEMI